MTTEERVKEFNEKYKALCEEYKLEIRPQIGITLFDMNPMSDVSESVSEIKDTQNDVKEAEIVETPQTEEKQA